MFLFQMEKPLFAQGGGIKEMLNYISAKPGDMVLIKYSDKRSEGEINVGNVAHDKDGLHLHGYILPLGRGESDMVIRHDDNLTRSDRIIRNDAHVTKIGKIGIETDISLMLKTGKTIDGKIIALKIEDYSKNNTITVKKNDKLSEILIRDIKDFFILKNNPFIEEK